MKNKLIFLAAAVSLVSSASVFATNNTDKSVVDQKSQVTKATTKKVAKKVRAVRVKSLKEKLDYLQSQIEDLQRQQELSHSSATSSKLYAYGPAIVTTPIIGEADYSGYDLYINFPSTNEDLGMLRFNKKLNDYYTQNNLQAPNRPVIAVSGEVEGKIEDVSSFNSQNSSDINLSTVALQTVANINPWVTGVAKVDYSNSAPETGARINGSRLKVARAFITIGNLNEFPLYATVGQMKVPFGAYNEWMITSPVTETLGETKERTILVGFDKAGIYGSVYAYKGDTYSASGRGINSWGANLGYTLTQSRWSLDTGLSYIANIADSLGMLDNGYGSYDQFQGFGKYRNDLEKQVPGAAVHTLFKFEPINIAAEYITAVGNFDKQDMRFNGVAAKPQALDLEAIYNFKVCDKPTFVSAGYGRTWEALALNLPKHSFFVSTGMTVLKNTIASIEYRHDINYADSDRAVIAGSESMMNSYFVPGNHTRNIVTATIKYYF